MNIKSLAAIWLLSATSLCAYAQEQAQAVEGIPEIVEHPVKRASSVVIFVPSVDMPLHVPIETDRVLEGEITSVEMGGIPRTIVLPAQTMIRPLFSGVPVQMYLKRVPEHEDVYFPIAIFTPKGVEQ